MEGLRHRGPNDYGTEVFSIADGVVGLGHTRLSIIDLSSAGHQPMVSPDERFVLVFNGEIYNYKELRSQLKSSGIEFRTETDTEVLLQAWAEWGVEAPPRLEGMFAFVIYDRSRQTLTCVRDPFGIKPFFYCLEEGQFFFSSEIGPLIGLRGRPPETNWQRSYDYLVHGDYDSGEDTFVEGIFHLMPGCLMEMRVKDQKVEGPRRWWNPSISQDDTYSFDDAAEILREKFLDSVRKQMRSDVPLGAALSGGIDSSAVVCSMRHLEPDIPVHTFSFVAADAEISEEKWIRRINDSVSATDYKTLATGRELSHDLVDMIRTQGEPFGSTSIYAQYRVFKLAKESGVTVTLDGQGADELLAGYRGYPGQRIMSLFESGKPIEAVRFARQWSRWPGRRHGDAWMYLGHLLLPDWMNSVARRARGRGFSPDWLNADRLREAGVTLKEPRPPLGKTARRRRVMERMRSSLQYRGLPGLLRHADRNSMRFSVESRVPFLSPSIAEFVYSLPEEYLISRGGETKSLFRRAMQGIVPEDVLRRKDKIGFATPERDWLKELDLDSVRDVANRSEVPFLDMPSIRALLARPDRANPALLWRIVCFLIWREECGR